jgi:energy-coupling factor transporter ATP-binding protein EcfA2
MTVRDELSLRDDFAARLRSGERVVLFGRRGAGKSTLITALARDFRESGMPCGVSTATAQLDDITRALQRAYPDVDVASIRRRAARSRLWIAADSRRCVLLLDHISQMNNAMVGYLRRLVGGVAGVLLVFDVDTPIERARIRAGRLGAVPRLMPPCSGSALHALLRTECQQRGLMLPSSAVERQLVRAAAGRPGWIVQAAALAVRERYWQEGHLSLINLLCSDAEVSVRYGARTLAELEGATRIPTQRDTSSMGYLGFR